jgi:hypothetical protein
VDLSVTRWQEFPEDGMVQVWGWVGDYEVSVWLPRHDPRLRPILPPKRTRAAKPKR